MLNTLGERIAYHRKKCNMTQEALAEQCSVTAQAVSKWENNLTAPDISLLPRLAEIFSVTCDELLGVKRTDTIAVDPAAVDLSKAMLKVRVLGNFTWSDEEDAKNLGKTKVNVNLPLSIAEAVLNSGAIHFGGEDDSSVLKQIDLKQIVALVKVGVMGKIVEIETENGHVVEVWVE